jgi:hypothetical protein
MRDITLGAPETEQGELLPRLQGKEVRITFAACMNPRRGTKVESKLILADTNHQRPKDSTSAIKLSNGFLMVLIW